MALLLSWQLTVAEVVGGPITIVLVALPLRLFVRQRMVGAAREQADWGLAGSLKGHAAMDISIALGWQRVWRRLGCRDGHPAGCQRGGRLAGQGLCGR